MEHIETLLKDILAELRALREQSEHGPRPFLSMKELARILGLSEKTIRNQLSNRKFPLRPLRVGGRVLFRVADLEAMGK